MQTDVMIHGWKRIIAKHEEEIMLDTIGDRLNQMLRERGRHDRGEPYTQVDLTDMLTGKTVAPDGRRYKIHTNKSTINRILTDKQEPPLEIVFAICDIFNRN